MSAGVFSPDGETLLIADPLSQAILPFSKNGHIRQSLPPLLRSTLKDFPPQVILQQGDRFYVETQRNRILTLGNDYSFKGQRIIQGASKKDADLTLDGIFLWQPAGLDFLAFGDVLTSAGRWSSAFVRFPVDDPASFEVLHSMGVNDPSKVFYQLGFPYLASIGGKGYALLMENPIGIYRSVRGGNGWEPLRAFPAGFDQSPMLPTFTLRKEYVSVMAQVERSRMPVGLYGWEGSLYVVVREPYQRRTRWTIYQIDPREDKVVAFARIPTQANHLTIVPGSKHWAFLEKGRVEDWGRQSTERVLFVPSSRLRNRLSAELCASGELAK